MGNGNVSTQNTYKHYTQTIPAGGFIPVGVYGRFVCILSVTDNQDIKISFDGDKEQEIYAGISIELPVGEYYKEFRLHNPNVSDVVVKYASGNGRINDNRLTLSADQISIIDISNGISTPASMSVSVKDSIASNANRKELIIQNNGTANILVGDTNITTTRGLLVEPGDSITLDTNAEVFLIAVTGTQTVAYMELTKS